MSSVVIGATGEFVDVAAYAGKPVPAFAGKHLWVIMSIYAVDNPARSSHMLSAEKTLTVIGPACYYCEAAYRPTLGAMCPGLVEATP